MKKSKPIMELLMFFVNEKDKQHLNELLSNYKATMQLSCHGNAIGDDDPATFWGFGVVEKEIVIALAPASKSKEILEKVCVALDLEKKHQGLGISIPLSSATSALAQKFLLKEKV